MIAYECFNGKERNIEEWRVQRLTPEYQNFVSQIKQFQRFRKLAAEANSTLHTWAVGCPFVSVCFGDSEGFRVQYTVPPPTESTREYSFEEEEPLKLGVTKERR